MLAKARPIWLPVSNMKPRHIVAGVIGLVILACWCVVSVTVNLIFHGVAFDD